MTKPMIRRIKKIDNYRIFQRWGPSPDSEFPRVNLIYGQNGSGKSTLANLMLGCAENDQEAFDSGLVLDVEFDGARTEVKASPGSAFWGRVRVFNNDFVRQNLSFEAEGGPQPQALLTIGKRNVDTETRLAELRKKLDEVRPKIAPEKKQAESTDKAVQDRLSAVAKTVVDDLRNSPDTRYRATNTYTKRQVREQLDEDKIILGEASTDLDADRKTATSEAMASLSPRVRGPISEEETVDEARRLLTVNVVVKVIENLRGQPERSSWVQQGIHLHDGLDKCLFCGQPLTADRRAELTAHFDESLKKLQEAIDVLVGRLGDSVNASKTYLDALPADASVYGDLKADLQRARAAYQAEHKTYSQTVEKIVAALKEKRNNPFDDVALDPQLTLIAPDVTRVDKIVAAHKEKITNHDEEARAAARRVELYHLKGFADEYEKLKKDVEEKNKTVKSLADEAADLERQILELENMDADPVPGADELTSCVAILLGRNELRFSTTPDGKHYIINRNDAPATNLSEGEQTAIALLYFLVSVREDKNTGDEPVVIIDDPVSSLDSGILFGASAYLWSELVTRTYASQVFLMTHDFELFRQWLVQMESVPKNARECGYSAYEIKTRYLVGDGDSVCREPKILPWKLGDNLKKRLRSQYHFLFYQVVGALRTANENPGLAAQMEAMALIPNAARRMMEAFLSFRCPEKMGSFHGSMRAVLDSKPGLDDSVRTRIERYLHTYSHMEEADITRPLDPSEATVVLKSLFQLMNHVDHEHFTSMCKALGFEAEILLRSSPDLIQPSEHEGER